MTWKHFLFQTLIQAVGSFLGMFIAIVLWMSIETAYFLWKKPKE